MTEELETLKSVILSLDEGEFDYLLTGSMAMSFYSVPRMTRDSNIIIQLFGKDVDKFIQLLAEDFFIDENMIRESLKTGMMFNIFNKKNFFKIDFILKSKDEYENLKFERRIRLRINGLEVSVISIEDLIISKLNWAKDSYSEMQIKDIRELMKNEFDEQYVKKWISKLNLNEVYSKI